MTTLVRRLLSIVGAMWLALSALVAYGQTTEPLVYQLFDKEGKPVKFEKLVAKAAKARVTFFGEMHNQSMVHWLQLQLAKQLFAQKKTDLKLGYEMIEADQQSALDSVNNGLLKAANLPRQRKMWPNYETDYQPIVDWAATNKVQQIGTNCPRRYASMVHKQGKDALLTLTDAEKAWLGPLPYEVDTTLPGYKGMFVMMGGHGGPRALQLVQAQALKDLTMASRIVNNLNANTCFLHLNGSYHSDNFEGIMAYLFKLGQNINLRPDQVVTISTVVAEGQWPIRRFVPDKDKQADFYLVVAPDAPTSY